MKSAFFIALLSVFVIAAPSFAQEKPEPFELRDGDVVAFVGNTFFEREQTYSYLEALLTTRFPDRDIIFRNLGWSGDTVFGHARAYFEGPDQGFERLRRHVDEVKPTVLFVAYGMSESFDGPAGLQSFRQGLERMLDMLKQNAAPEARFVLISPIRHEALGEPYPDPAEHNRSLKLYTEAIEQVAESRGHRFLNLFDDFIPAPHGDETPQTPLTDNGIHLSPYGYWRAANKIEQDLGYEPRGWELKIDAAKGAASGTGVEVSDVKKLRKGLTFTLTEPLVPVLPPKLDAPADLAAELSRLVRIMGLKAGSHTLTSGTDKADNGITRTAQEWAKGVRLSSDVNGARSEALRQLIVSKNVQFFNRYRPQNETYIFGFRAGEQGRNAVEIPMFDKPIAEKEAEIAKLRVPQPVTYTLEPRASTE